LGIWWNNQSDANQSIVNHQTVVHCPGGASGAIDLRKQWVLAPRDGVSKMRVGGTQSEGVAGSVTSAAASAVSAKTLKERTTQIDPSGIAVRARQTCKVEKWKQVRKVNVGDGRTCGNGQENGGTDNNPPADGAPEKAV